MIIKMHHNDNSLGILGTGLTIFLGIFHNLSKDDISWSLGVIVALLTIAYYVVKLYKELKK